jgi:hypothetical protein
VHRFSALLRLAGWLLLLTSKKTTDATEAAFLLRFFLISLDTSLELALQPSQEVTDRSSASPSKTFQLVHLGITVLRTGTR